MARDGQGRRGYVKEEGEPPFPRPSFQGVTLAMPLRMSSVSPQVGLPLTCALMPSTVVSTKCPRQGQNGSRATGSDRINAHDI